MKTTKVLISLLVIGSLGWIGCSKAEEPAPEPATAEAPAPEPTPEVVEEEATKEGAIVIESDDLMKYNLDAFEVKAGEEVTLTLKHIGKMAKELMGHNVVILNAGGTVADFGAAVMQNGGSVENGYLPEALADQVLAATELIGGGEETTITFTAPDAGEYVFLCTFPGHFAVMKGVMTSV